MSGHCLCNLFGCQGLCTCVCVPSSLHNMFLLLGSLYPLIMCFSSIWQAAGMCVWNMEKVKWDIYLLRGDADLPCIGPANYSKEAAAGILSAGISAFTLIRHLLKEPGRPAGSIILPQSLYTSCQILPYRISSLKLFMNWIELVIVQPNGGSLKHCRHNAISNVCG